MFWIIIGAICGGSLIVMAVLAWRAPEGYEDEGGFHLGRLDEEPGPDDSAAE